MLRKSTITNEIGYALTAITFLTRIPLSKWAIHKPDALAKAFVYFPLVGIIMGTLIGIVFTICSGLWNQDIAIIAAITSGIILTGAFHEDGFADVCDSLGAFDTEKKLLIMKDSHLGTFGVCGLICLLLVKFFALQSIAGHSQNLFAVFILAHTVSRWSSLPLIHFNPYVSRNAKSGKSLLADANNEGRMMIASGLTLVILMLFGSNNIFNLILGVLLVILASQYFFRKSLGGITGDCLGATNQLTEVTIYLVLALNV